MTPSSDSAPDPRHTLVALVGNPNSGKTTLFNALTGLSYKVANYPGVTVERKESQLTLDEYGDILLLDLPGTYHLAGSALDEKVTSDVVLGKTPSLPAPSAIVAVVDSTNLERNLFLITQLIDSGTPLLVVLTMSDLAEKRGIVIHKEILSRLLDVPVVNTIAHQNIGLDDLRRELSSLLKSRRASSKAGTWKQLPATDDKISAAACACSAVRPPSAPNATQGSASTAKAHSAKLEAVSPRDAAKRFAWIRQAAQRCSYRRPVEGSRGQVLDYVVTHRVWGALVFLLVMSAMFQTVFTGALPFSALITKGFSAVNSAALTYLPEGELRSLLTDGLLAGIGSVAAFIPQIALLFLFLGILEDSGYLSRAAFVMDKLFSRIGLQGRSFIPLLSSFGCAVPGILASRTIPSRSDRIATILVSPLMSCSARLPVYTLLISAFIPSIAVARVFSLQGLVLLGIYLLGIATACLIAKLLKLSVLRGSDSYLVMELPPFRRPTARVVLRQTWDSVSAFLKNAGGMIILCSIVLWFLASHPQSGLSRPADILQQSYLSRIGHLIEPIVKPLGYNWEIGVAILGSFAAREVFVSSLASVYSLASSEDSHSLVSILQQKTAEGTFSLLTGLSLIVFFAYACQCVSTLAVCRRETASWRWMVFLFSYSMLLAYFGALAVYQIGRML